MTKLEKDFIEALVTTVGTSITITHDKAIIGGFGELNEPIEIPITHENLDMVRDVKKPLIERLGEITNEDRFISDLSILEKMYITLKE